MGARLDDSRTLGLIGLSALAVYVAALAAAFIITGGDEPVTLSSVRGTQVHMAGTAAAGLLGIAAGAGLCMKGRKGTFIAKVRGILTVAASAALVIAALATGGSQPILLFALLVVAAAFAAAGQWWVEGDRIRMILALASALLVATTAAVDVRGYPFIIAAAFWVITTSLIRPVADRPSESATETAPAVEPATGAAIGSAAATRSAPVPVPPADPVPAAAAPADLPELKVMSSREAADARNAKMSSIADDAVADGPAEEPVPDTPPVEGSGGGPAAGEPASVPPEAEDEYRDTPEILVRRAAWNKGLRCRRNYGDHGIPVAFVKSRVAVYVSPADADRGIDDILNSEGWTVLRFSEDEVTDGRAEGEEIAEAVRRNLRAQRKPSKRKGAGR